MTEMLRPKPSRLLSLLLAFGAGGDKKPFVPFAGVTSIPNTGDLSSDNFSQTAIALAGYKAVGTRIVRFDILNRLAFMIRDAQAQFKADAIPGNHGMKFQLMQEMLALLGSGYEDAEAVLTALRFKSETAETSLTRTEGGVAEEAAPEAKPQEPTQEDVKTEAALVAAATPETPAPDAPEPETAAPAETDAPVATTATDAPLLETPAPDAPVPETAKAAQPEASPKLTAKPKKQTAAKRLTPYAPRDVAEDGTVSFKPNMTYWSIPARTQKSFKPKPAQGNKSNPRYNKNANRDGKSGQGNRNNDAPRNAKPTKPPRNLENSPFAALAALQLPKKGK